MNRKSGMASVLVACVVGMSVIAAELFGSPFPAPTTEVTALRTEYAENPVGIDARMPRLGWQLKADRRGVSQSAYQIRVALNEQDLRGARNLAWDSGQTKSDVSVLVPYSGLALRTG